MAIEVTTQAEKNRLVLNIEEVKLNLYHLPILEAEIAKGLSDNIKEIVINLAKVNYLDSSALGSILKIKRDLAEKKIELALACVNETVAMVLKITKISQLIKVLDRL